MNGKLILVVVVLFVLGYMFFRTPDPTPNTLASDYSTTVATLATVAAYESLSVPKEVVEDPIVEEVVHEVAEQMELLEPVQEVVVVPVSQSVESDVESVETPTEIIEEAIEKTVLDDTENVAWEKLNDMREKAGLKRLTFASDLLDGCRKHADNQRKRKVLWHDKNKGGGVGENCAVSRSEDGELPIGQWYGSGDHRRFMLSRSIEEGAIGRSGTYWVFRAKWSTPSTKTVTIVEDTGDVTSPDNSDGNVKVKERSVQNSCTGNSCTTGYASDGQRNVKTYSRIGRHRPLRYALWRALN
jgi:uncharacterized protein YkwD